MSPGDTCTNYAAYVESAAFGVRAPHYNLGNAGSWAVNARAHGVRVDHRPAVGAVAEWNGYDPGLGPLGHVAIVERVGPHARYIVISQQSISSDKNGYDWTRINAGTATWQEWPDNFLHFTRHPAPWGGVGSATFKGTDRLATGQQLASEQYLASPDDQYALLLQKDGNLVLYHGAGARWASNTRGRGGVALVMQADGNLVLSTSAGATVWSTATTGGPSYLVLQDDGALAVYPNAGGGATWTSNTAGPPLFTYAGSNHLAARQKLMRGHYLRSTDLRHALLLRRGGNLVLYGPGYHVLWASHTAGKSVAGLILRRNGNLVLYSVTGATVWSTHTAGTGPSRLVLQSDGNLVLYDAAGHATWSSRTWGRI